LLLGKSLASLYVQQLNNVLTHSLRLHMFYGQRCIDIPDGLPKWTGLNKESELIEDSPPDQIKEHARQREEERKKRFEKGEAK
jgi:hypothetical protein